MLGEKLNNVNLTKLLFHCIEAGDFSKILAEMVINFQAVIEQYYKAQEVVKSEK